MNSSEENPAPINASAAKAFGTVTILPGVNRVQDTLIVNITYNGLTAGGITAAHIHGPAARGANAGVMIGFTPGTDFVAGTLSGTIRDTSLITAGQLNDILREFTYLNIHTNTNPGGEIRGQIDSISANPAGKVPAASNPLLVLLTLALAGSGALYLMRRRATAA